MAIDCAACPLRRRGNFEAFSDKEIAFMRKFKTGEMQVDPGTLILSQGLSSAHLFTVLSGTGLRYRTLPSGERQVIQFVMPGDFLGLQAGVMHEMGHSAEATSDMVLCVFNRGDLWSLFKSMPERGYALTHLAAIQEHFLGDALATVGQRPAYEKVGWAVHNLYQRAANLGLVRNDAFDFPFRQQDLADALGLSLVHTNKTLAKLRANGVFLWRDGRITVYDQSALSKIADCDAIPRQPLPLI